MRQKFYRLAALLTAGLLVAACQTTPQPTAPAQPVVVKVITPVTETAGKPDYSDLYLQGTFNWWNAGEEYKVNQVKPSLYRVKTHLVADGQFYDFKFANPDYDTLKNCGYLNSSQAVLTAQSAAVVANCSSEGDYFRFNPKKTGNYYFYFDSKGVQPKVYVRKAS